MSLKEQNQKRWDDCHIPQANGPAFQQAANKLMAPEARLQYEAVVKALKEMGYPGMPWEFVAVAHYRESNANFNTFLGNGQPLSRKTTIVPKGRGPFPDWKSGAIDALVNCAPYSAKNKDWSIGGMLAELEKYNGLGYANKGLPSPYIWAGTDQYVKGKYVSDGVYDPNHVDKQLGCAGILKFMGYGRKAPTGVGSVIVAGGAAAGGAAATVSPSWWAYVQEHWVVLGLAAIGIALFIDFAIALYNNEKNNKNVR